MDAKIQYLMEVKDFFGAEESKYYEFLKIFWDFTQKVNGDAIVGRVKTLFNGDERLVMGFYRLLLDTKRKPTTARPADEFSMAFEFVGQMMKRGANPHSDSNVPALEIVRVEVDAGRTEGSNMTCCRKSKKPTGLIKKLARVHRNGDRLVDRNFEESKKSTTSSKRKRDRREEHHHDKDPSFVPRNKESQKRSSSSRKKLLSHEMMMTTEELMVKSFTLEDDMFHADVLLSTVTQTAKKLLGKIKMMPGGEEEINKVLHGRENTKGTFDGEEQIEERPGDKELTIANLKCAEQFYYESWIDIQMALVRENPMELVEIVSNLLWWKEDIEKSRAGLHAIAHEALARNATLMRKTAAR